MGGGTGSPCFLRLARLPDLRSAVREVNRRACEPIAKRLECGMAAVRIIEDMKRLPREEQTRVIEFARQVGENRPLTPEELGQLAKRMVEAKDSAEADRLQEQIEHGFYGGPPHA